jgi:membrane protein DedA with SNARE-associated domain
MTCPVLSYVWTEGCAQSRLAEEGEQVLEWFGSIAGAVLTMGYVGVLIALVIEGLGLPFPGDVMMAFYGFAAARGDLHLAGVFLYSMIGYLIGTTMAYVVSRRYGREWLARAARRMLISERNMMRTTSLMERYGPWLLVPGRFLPGVRSVSSYVAGVGDMDFRDFLLYTGIGASLWCAVWISVGYWCGDHLDAVIHAVQSGLAYLTGAVLVGLLAFWIYRRRFH